MGCVNPIESVIVREEGSRVLLERVGEWEGGQITPIHHHVGIVRRSSVGVCNVLPRVEVHGELKNVKGVPEKARVSQSMVFGFDRNSHAIVVNAGNDFHENGPG